MKIIDIIIFFLCAVGLVYFVIDRFKYRDINVYHDKLERLNELRKLITAIEIENGKHENIFKPVGANNIFDDEQTEKYFIYEEKLSNLKNEKKKIERYIENFRLYNKKLIK